MFLAYFIRTLLWLLIRTCKFKVLGGEHLKDSSIVMLWHNQLVLIAPSLFKVAPKLSYCAFISNSKDGNLLAAFTTSYSNGHVIRVPHHSRESALKALIDRLKTKKDIAVITPDGPRGPRHKIKPGIVLAAKETGAPIIPFSWVCSNTWKLKTWDKMEIPKPFSTIEAVFSPPITLSKDTSIQEDITWLEKGIYS